MSQMTLKLATNFKNLAGLPNSLPQNKLHILGKKNCDKNKKNYIASSGRLLWFWPLVYTKEDKKKLKEIFYFCNDLIIMRCENRGTKQHLKSFSAVQTEKLLRVLMPSSGLSNSIISFPFQIATSYWEMHRSPRSSPLCTARMASASSPASPEPRLCRKDAPASSCTDRKLKTNTKPR